ncbi:unnamed protein product [Spodoptera exigua]|nr:unnamed protein product [Spodoptera exigua]
MARGVTQGRPTGDSADVRGICQPRIHQDLRTSHHKTKATSPPRSLTLQPLKIIWATLGSFERARRDLPIGPDGITKFSPTSTKIQRRSKTTLVTTIKVHAGLKLSSSGSIGLLTGQQQQTTS